jgi:hypothetical protein
MDLFSPGPRRLARPPRASSSAAAVPNSSSGASAAAVPLEHSSAATASVGTSSVRPGRPILNTVRNSTLPEPLMVPVRSHSATSLPTLRVVPPYTLGAFYATQPTLVAQGIEHRPEDTSRLGIDSSFAKRLYIHPEFKNIIFIKVNKPYFKPNRFYPNDTINEGSYFHEGYTFDQLIQMEKERRQRFLDRYYRKTKGGKHRHTRRHRKTRRRN